MADVKGRMVFLVLGGIVFIAVILALFYTNAQRSTQKNLSSQLVKENTMGTLTVTSPQFRPNTAIPSRYTCQGNDTNPPLSIAGVPEGAKSLVLIMDDPDAPVGVWDHWIVWNIRPDTREIAENSVPSDAVQGTNSAGRVGYQGPCPPFGMHRYVFTLFALSDTLSLQQGATKAQVHAAITGKILDQFTLIGLYQKK